MEGKGSGGGERERRSGEGAAERRGSGGGPRGRWRRARGAVCVRSTGGLAGQVGARTEPGAGGLGGEEERGAVCDQLGVDGCDGGLKLGEGARTASVRRALVASAGGLARPLVDAERLEAGVRFEDEEILGVGGGLGEVVGGLEGQLRVGTRRVLALDALSQLRVRSAHERLEASPECVEPAIRQCEAHAVLHKLGVELSARLSARRAQ